MLTMHRFLFSLLVIFCISLPPLFADETTTNSDTTKSATTEEQQDSDKSSSEVERLLKLEKTLKNDKIKLRDFSNNLSDRAKISKQLQTLLKQSSTRLDELNAALLSATEKADNEQSARLKDEIKKLETDNNLLKEQTQLTFEAEKTVRNQIELLEKSITQQQLAMDQIKGVNQPELTKPQKPAVPTPTEPEKKTPSLPTSPIQKMVMPKAQPTSEVEPVTSSGIDHLKTAEQIEAHKQAEKRSQEAYIAEQVTVDFIEQKSIFLEQIKLDETLLKADTESLENYKNIKDVQETKLKDQSKTKLNKEQRDTIRQNLKIVKNQIKKLEKQIKKRTASLKQAKKLINQREDDQAQLAKEALKKREDAEAAQKHVIWLQSPLHPRNLLAWAYTRGPRVILVLIIMALLLFINNISASKISRVMARKSVRKGEMSQNRVDTLALSFRGAARVIIVFGGMLVALQEAGLDIKTVLGGAAIIGVAIAFGAQNLMRDYFNGFMILLEDQYELNDVVTINDITGTVERVSMRTTMIRDLNGRAHFIPNGVITRVSNTTYEWARAVFEITVAYKENVDHVMSVILDLANELQQDKKFGSAILSDPEMLGVNSFDENGVTIKFMLQTRADKMWPVRREMLRRIKNKFDELSIEIPVPQRVIQQQNENGTNPA